MTSGGHFREVCEYGQSHAQCRCADPSKAVRHVRCTMPQAHAPKAVTVPAPPPPAPLPVPPPPRAWPPPLETKDQL